MKYMDIKKYDIANGEGVRVSIFVSGCTHKCKGCFNSELWDFEYGMDFTGATINEIIEAISPNYIKGLSLLGGEPMELKNQIGLLPLVRKFKEIYPNKDIWCYSGYLYEYLKEQSSVHEETKELLNSIDVLVDGKFELEKKDINLLFRGSSNQRIIDLKESNIKGEIVLHRKNKRRGDL